MGEPPATSYTGLDIVFLVDQSGSMKGDPVYHPIPNDPAGWRFEALKVLSNLVGPALFHNYKEMTVRFAVIEFGSEAKVAIPVTTIQARSFEEWQPQKAEIEQALADYRAQRENTHMGNTDHRAAFELARRLFDEMEAADPSRRLKAIILVTDGSPCIPPPGEENCVHFDWSGYMRNLRDKYIPTEFPCDEFYIYVLGINDSADNYWPRSAPYWEPIATCH